MTIPDWPYFAFWGIGAIIFVVCVIVIVNRLNVIIEILHNG